MRSINRLTAKTVASLQEPGLHADGAGLYLRIDQTLNKRWVYIYSWAGKRREMGLGSAAPHSVALKDAREAAATAREQVRSGIDPILARKAAERAAATFGELADEVIQGMRDAWRSERTARQWESSLKQHAKALWKRPVAEIASEDVIAVLRPIWTVLPETAGRVRSRICHILDVAKVKGLRSGENPARWDGHLKLLMPARGQDRGNFAALPYEDLPGFMVQLRARRATAARALEYLILGANRTGEVILARWSEIEGDVWVIPSERMKGGKEHRVPLTSRMLEILDEMRPLQRNAEDLIFPGEQRIEPLSNMAMLKLLGRMGVGVTVHGFRSTFRDWAGDCTDYPHEVIEHCLAHKVGDAVVRAYRRRNALDKRRALMSEWATYCAKPNHNVVPLFKA